MKYIVLALAIMANANASSGVAPLTDRQAIVEEINSTPGVQYVSSIVKCQVSNVKNEG